MPLLVMIVCLILYGSLYPFDFSSDANTPARQLALASPLGHFTLRDALGNFLLFMPLGLASRHHMQHRWSAKNNHAALVTGLMASAAFAFGAQIPQLWLPTRDPALTDVWFNVLGCGVGFGLAAVLRPELFVSAWTTAPPALPDRFMRRPPRARGPLLAVWGMAGLFLIYGLWPGSGEQQFYWTPWSVYLQGDLMINAIRLGGVVVYCLAFIIVCTRAFGRVRIGVIWLTLLSLLILLIRSVIDIGRAVDVGDIVLPLLCGIVIAALRKPALPTTASQLGSRTDAEIAMPDAAIGNSNQLVKGLGIFSAGVLLASLVLFVVLRLPGIPYNVRDIFGGGASLPACILLMSSLACAGFVARGGAALLHRAAGWLIAPFALAAGCLLLFVLMSRAISSETMMDFGVAYDVTGRTALLGSVSAKLPALEEALRFAALIYPILAATALVRAFAVTPQGSHRAFHAADFVRASVMVCFILLAGLITLVWPSSDNITELVARLSSDGRPGAVLLLGLCFAVAVGGNSLASMNNQTWARQCVTTGLACGVSWLLIRFGLTSQLTKYGSTFRGIDFLLGPDRQHFLSEPTLFLRWCFVYLTGVALLALPLRYPARLTGPVSAPRH